MEFLGKSKVQIFNKVHMHNFRESQFAKLLLLCSLNDFNISKNINEIYFTLKINEILHEAPLNFQTEITPKMDLIYKWASEQFALINYHEYI